MSSLLNTRIDRRQFIFATAAASVAALASPLDRALAAQTQARAMLKQMTLRERIGQMFFFEARGMVMSPGYLADLEGVLPGGVLVVGANIGTAAQFSAFVSGIHGSNALVPPFICIDQEGGPVTRLAGDPAPGAVAMGTLSDGEVKVLAQERATFLGQYGIDVNFAPVADIAYDANSTMATRSFGSDPDKVAKKVVAMVNGSRSGGVIGAAKHFPGHGRTTTDSHQTIPEIDVPWDEWLRTDAVPFRSAIRNHVEMIMLGHLRYDRIDYKPMSLSRTAVRALQEELSFGGIVVTDDLGMGALAEWDSMDKVSQAIDAGIDVMLYLSPDVGWAALVDHVYGMISGGLVARQEINRRAEKVVALKIRHFSLTA